jgi:cytochrome c peroxidase
MMHGHRILRWTAPVAGVVLLGLLVTLLSRERPLPVSVDTRHGTVRLAEGDGARILRAAEAVSAQATQDELVARGRTLFRSAAMGKDGETCQTCHAEGAASPLLGTIGHPRASGDFTGPRDPPALWSVARTAPYFWDGSVATLREAAIRPVLDHFKAFPDRGCTQADAAAKDACLARAGEFAAAIAAFLEQLDPPVSAFDQGTLSAAARRGEGLFQGKGGCFACHGGPQFTDNLVHNTGAPQVSMGPGASSDDNGAGPPPLPPGCRVTPLPEGCEPMPPGPFINTPQLRDVANTAPYFHNGRFKTLREVVDFYNSQSLLSPLHLTPAEVSDIVAFLEGL